MQAYRPTSKSIYLSLCGPPDYGIFDCLKDILSCFTKHVDGLLSIVYGDILKAIKLQSIQRRHKRYRIIYIYKFKEGHVPNFLLGPANLQNSLALKFSNSLHGGCRCFLPKTRSAKQKPLSFFLSMTQAPYVIERKKES